MSPEDKARCMSVLSDTFRGEHHIPGQVIDNELYLLTKIPGALSTFDFDELTRLVFAAHRHAVRVQVTATAGPTPRVTLMLHPRVREGGLSRRHPTIKQAMEAFGGAEW